MFGFDARALNNSDKTFNYKKRQILLHKMLMFNIKLTNVKQKRGYLT